MRWNEEVARKEKVCPMTMRFTEDGRFRSNNCAGSKCMAWRGSRRVPTTFDLQITSIVRIAEAAVEKQTEASEIPAEEKETTGYCGLAGTPEVGAQ